jgi:hypothetical protein
MNMDLNTLLGTTVQVQTTLENVHWFLTNQQAKWHALDVAWRPLMKLLVRLQNRYLPELTGRIRILYDSEQRSQVDPWSNEHKRFDPQQVIRDLGVSPDQVTEAYWFLIERGIDREPRDGLELLRRARPRSSQLRWRGPVRHAQDHFDAAQILRLFLVDLTGQAPPRPRLWPMDGRQRERAHLYAVGPASLPSRKDLQEELVNAGLYPHSVHIVGEGKSEKEIISTIVAGMIGEQSASELGFTDLGGSGMANRLTTMVGGFTTYAQRTIVVVDSEGDMVSYVNGLTRSGDLSPEDVCMFQRNLEESNFSLDELLEVLNTCAANPPDGQEPVALRLQADDVIREHEARCESNRRQGKALPGLAGTLLRLAENPDYGDSIRISKPDFAIALAERMLDEIGQAGNDESACDAVLNKRPLLKFVVNRMMPILAQPQWGR